MVYLHLFAIYLPTFGHFRAWIYGKYTIHLSTESFFVSMIAIPFSFPMAFLHFFFRLGEPQPPNGFSTQLRSSALFGLLEDPQTLHLSGGVWWDVLGPWDGDVFFSSNRYLFLDKNKMLGGLNVQKSRISKSFQESNINLLQELSERFMNLESYSGWIIFTKTPISESCPDISILHYHLALWNKSINHPFSVKQQTNFHPPTQPSWKRLSPPPNAFNLKIFPGFFFLQLTPWNARCVHVPSRPPKLSEPPATGSVFFRYPCNDDTYVPPKGKLGKSSTQNAFKRVDVDVFFRSLEGNLTLQCWILPIASWWPPFPFLYG